MIKVKRHEFVLVCLFCFKEDCLFCLIQDKMKSLNLSFLWYSNPDYLSVLLGSGQTIAYHTESIIKAIQGTLYVANKSI